MLFSEKAMVPNSKGMQSGYPEVRYESHPTGWASVVQQTHRSSCLTISGAAPPGEYGECAESHFSYPQAHENASSLKFYPRHRPPFRSGSGIFEVLMRRPALYNKVNKAHVDNVSPCSTHSTNRVHGEVLKHTRIATWALD